MSTDEAILQLPDSDSYQYSIYNCAGASKGVKASACPGSWNNLAPGYVESVRKCTQCGRNVYMGKDEAQVRTYDALKYSFVIDIVAIENERQQKSGLPLPFSAQIERRKTTVTDIRPVKKVYGERDVHSELEQFHRHRQAAA